MKSDNIELITDTSPIQMWQSSDSSWFNLDSQITSLTEMYVNVKEQEVANDFLFFVDYIYQNDICNLLWNHDKYFVSVIGEQNVEFSVIYINSYDINITTACPKVEYWNGNQPYNIQSINLDFVDLNHPGLLYKKEVSLPLGVYNYRYSCENFDLNEVYSLETSSFVVSQRPVGIISSNIKDSSIVSNASLILRWDLEDKSNQNIQYKLYFGNSIDKLTLIYQGENNYYKLNNLDYGKQYYWQVETINEYGVSSKSQVSKFSTISNVVSKAFNYPNPFNPCNNELTNMVFEMKECGSVEIGIYSEYGNLCWQKTYDSINAGVNEVSYDGKDDNGKVLYNGTYICFIKKKYFEKEDIEKCRMLIIK